MKGAVLPSVGDISTAKLRGKAYKLIISVDLPHVLTCVSDLEGQGKVERTQIDQ